METDELKRIHDEEVERQQATALTTTESHVWVDIVECSGDCTCVDGAASCELNAQGKEAAKGATLSCGSSLVCAIKCVGESACSNGRLLAGGAVREMAVVCEGAGAQLSCAR